jgi:hypothetical protein
LGDKPIEFRVLLTESNRKEFAMSLNRVLLFAVTLILIFAFEDQSSAQVRGQRGPIRKAGMITGLGWGNGNHWRNPGVNPGYYNPWTAHNSTYYSRGYGSPDFQTDNGNTIYVQPGASWNQLPGEVIHSEIEAQPEPQPDNPQPPADTGKPDVETPNPDTGDSVSGWNVDKTEFEGDNLFERPVMDQPKYKPTVIDNSVNKKIEDLKDNNFWNDK